MKLYKISPYFNCDFGFVALLLVALNAIPTDTTLRG